MTSRVWTGMALAISGWATSASTSFGGSAARTLWLARTQTEMARLRVSFFITTRRAGAGRYSRRLIPARIRAEKFAGARSIDRFSA